MIRKYHNHKLQTNLWHGKEEPHNNHETPEKKAKQSDQLSLPHQDDCETSMGHEVTHNETYNNYRIPQWESQSTMNQQQQNHPLRMDSNLSHWGGLNAFYWYQISALDSVVVKAQKMLSSHGGFLHFAMYHHKETI